jgi:hypothetical protein
MVPPRTIKQKRMIHQSSFRSRIQDYFATYSNCSCCAAYTGTILERPNDKHPHQNCCRRTGTEMTLQRKKRWSMLWLSIAAFLLLLLLVIASIRQERNEIEITTSPDVYMKTAETIPPIQLPDMEGCSVGTAVVADSSLSNNNKPFWVPSYPASDNSLFAALVIALTGDVGSNAKSYYASSPTLKKCFTRKGYTMTITCQQLHPIVGIGPLPEKQVDKFQPLVIMPIRNPLTCVPEHYQLKAVMYHGETAQVSVDSWRSYRDEWLEKGIISGWKSVVTTWKDMVEYQGIGLYVPFEHVLDVHRGPIVVDQLATILRNAGFPVVPSADVSCVWYRVTKKHIQAAIDRSTTTGMTEQQLLRYPFATEYVPGYTVLQKEYMISELKQLQTMYPNDTVLVSILDDYIHETQSTKINDQSSNNTSLP